jgi:hypothetical protein
MDRTTILRAEINNFRTIFSKQVFKISRLIVLLLKEYARIRSKVLETDDKRIQYKSTCKEQEERGERCSKKILKKKKDARTAFWRIGKEGAEKVNLVGAKAKKYEKCQKTEKYSSSGSYL